MRITALHPVQIYWSAFKMNLVDIAADLDLITVKDKNSLNLIQSLKTKVKIWSLIFANY